MSFSINSGNEKKREKETLYASNISAMMIDTKVMVVLIKYTLNISSVLTIQNVLYTVYLIEYTLNNHTEWNAMHRS